jgi:zinc transporter ZupT
MVNYYGMTMGLYSQKGITLWISRHLNFEKGLFAGMVLFFSGVLISALAVYKWYQVSFLDLNPQDIFRVIIPAGFCMIAGLQVVVFSFFITLIKNNN